MCFSALTHTNIRNIAGVPSIVAAAGIPSLVAAMQTKFIAADLPHSTRMLIHAWNAMGVILLSADTHCETFALHGGIGMLVQVCNTAPDNTDTTLFTH